MGTFAAFVAGGLVYFITRDIDATLVATGLCLIIELAIQREI